MVFTICDVKADKIGKQQNNCGPEDKVCTFWLTVEEKLTMRLGRNLVYPFDGKLYLYHVTKPDNNSKSINQDDVITADGDINSRVVYAVNGTIPGPQLEVYQGQVVIIHVKNNLRAEGLSMHWHGIHVKGTPWMDGVSYVTQCPIGPGQSFSYMFKITESSGTYWYHSHAGAQRTMGVAGAFIVKDKETNMTFDRTAIVTDWNHDWTSLESQLQHDNGMFIGKAKYRQTHAVDESIFPLMPFQSGLVNGKGPVSYTHLTLPTKA